MKINAVGVVSSNLQSTIKFYSLLGFEFPEFKEEEQHIEPITSPGSTRLMIDSKELIKDLINADPQPGNTSAFAIEFDSPQELDKTAEKIKEGGYKIVKEPWDAFWGQRYCVISDPDGFMIDLYARL
jgi:uncharacterized glyoxalase superfamily protein PhnB